MKKTPLLVSSLLLSLTINSPLFAQQQLEQYRQEEIGERVQEMLEIQRRAEPKDIFPKEKAKEGEALRPTEEGIVLSPDYQKTIYQVSKAIDLINQGKYDEARDVLVSFLSDSRLWYASSKTTQSQVLYLLGYVNYQVKNLSEAEQFLKLQIEFTGVRDPETLNLLGLIKRERREYEDSEYYLKEAIRRAPPSQKPRYQYNLGNVYLDQQKWQQAYDVLKESYQNSTFWKAQPTSERVFLIYSYAYAAREGGRVDESNVLFEAIEDSEFLPDALRRQIAIFLGKKVPVPAEAKKWTFLLRPTALFDTNAQFLPSVGPGASTISQQTMAYTILFAPFYQEALSEKVAFQFGDFLYYIYHQDRDLEVTDLLNNSTLFKFLFPFQSAKYLQRIDTEFRIDLPFFNSDGLQLFYQQYSFIPSWFVFWTERLASRVYGTVQGITFRDDNPTPADRLSGVDLYLGLEGTILLGRRPWRLTGGYEYHRAQRKGTNFIANYNQVNTSLLTPLYFDAIQLFFRGKFQFGDYPQYSPLPRREEFTYDLLWNVFYNFTQTVSLYTSINWMHNNSDEQTQFEYDKEVYEGGISFLF